MDADEKRTAMLLTDQEWDDLTAMLQPHVLRPSQRRWVAAWEHQMPKWRVARRRGDLAARIIEANTPASGRVTEGKGTQ